ncbi:MAG: M48 family metalloprotease [Candidatus Eremiobacteraeota bacterium]|nr:M48 family metalloprotease [Candidatus Eremiobacteraeota bacterium]
MRRFLFGLGAGLTAGYALYRLGEAMAALRRPAPTFSKDAAHYGRIRRNLEVSNALRTIATAAALSAGGFGARLQRVTDPLPVALRPAILAVAGLLADTLFELPASFVEDYEVERRFALSDQLPRAWFNDHAKALAVSSVMIAAISIPFATLLRRKPNAWPLFATLALLPFFVLMALVLPVYVAPLFNRFEPLVGPLEERLRGLAARFGVGDAAILRMDMSRQTKKANAYVTGLFRTHRIVVGDTLLKSFPDDEIEFVVAHELGHYVAHDSWRLCAFGVVVAGATFWLANLTMPPTQRRSYDKSDALYRLYVRMALVSTLLRPILFGFTRSREWAADRFAIAATSAPQVGCAAFTRLREQNLAEEEVPPWYELLFSTHPSLGKRIAALRRSAERARSEQNGGMHGTQPAGKVGLARNVGS